jgi:methyltransferase-like protein 6
MATMHAVSYYDHDFDFNEWKITTQSFSLPEISDEQASIDNISADPCNHAGNEGACLEQDRWDSFYECHRAGLFYKPRRYIAKEFAASFYSLNEGDIHKSITLLEVGCGYGCTIFPLLESLESASFIATDFSQRALNIMSTHKAFDPSRISLIQWDITCAPTATLSLSTDALLCIFALSAIHPDHHRIVLSNLHAVIRSGGYLLFRDYAIHDMTMYRHVSRLGEYLFRRQDGTLAYYFSCEHLEQIAHECGFEIIEMQYATVMVRNRSSNVGMNRVFLHAVLRKTSGD